MSADEGRPGAGDLNGSPTARQLVQERAVDTAAQEPPCARVDAGGAWRVVVTPPAGRTAKVTVVLYVPAAATTPCCVDACDLVREGARRRVEERAAEQGVAPAALVRLGATLRELALQLADSSRGAPRDAARDAGRFALPEPEPWPEPVDGAAVLEEVVAFITRHMAIAPEAAVVCALWVAHAYLFDLWPVTPYLLVVSPTRACGKTTLLDLLVALVPRPLRASDATPAVIFRAIEKFGPTVFLDEIDSWLTRKREDGLVNLINAGSSPGTPALRTAGEGAAMDVKAFNVFSPKVLAGIAAPLPDATRSRCIAIRLERATPEKLAQLQRFSARDADSAKPLASKLARWAADLRADGRLAERVASLPAELSGREEDVWTPLVAIADAAGGRWPKAIRAAVAAFVAAAALEETRDLALLALSDAREYCRERRLPPGALVPTADLLEWMKGDELRPWATVGRDGLTPRKLSEFLKRFGVAPVQRRDGGEKARGYERDAILAAAERYCAEGGNAAAAPAETGQAGQSGQRAGSIGQSAPEGLAGGEARPGAPAPDAGSGPAPGVPLVPDVPVVPVVPDVPVVPLCAKGSNGIPPRRLEGWEFLGLFDDETDVP